MESMRAEHRTGGKGAYGEKQERGRREGAGPRSSVQGQQEGTLVLGEQRVSKEEQGGLVNEKEV